MADDPDAVHFEHPQHYGGDTVYEAIKVIHAWKLGFNLGNCVKYICRRGEKSREGDKIDLDAIIIDLKKARFYLDYEIRMLEESRTPLVQWEEDQRA